VDKQKTIAFRVDLDTHRAIKIASAIERKTMQEIVKQAMRDYKAPRQPRPGARP
jgi:uncharacterized protein (DUF1778 family)